ncbi:hypothetical protein LTR85_012109 [Meristemomyces frigidus]|nr:hypothetical protein LTR85_012109 [Meristemomyces frigidus]
MLGRSDLAISKGSDEQDIVRAATELVDNGKWHLTEGGVGLERPFKFKTFKATWAFMNDVAEECQRQKHHPEWANVYSRTEIRWTTHSPKGMSAKDTHMARFCDEAAQRHGEQYPKQAETKTEGGPVVEAGDCCGHTHTKPDGG